MVPSFFLLLEWQGEGNRRRAWLFVITAVELTIAALMRWPRYLVANISLALRVIATMQIAGRYLAAISATSGYWQM
jgi:hypothetical protein